MGSTSSTSRAVADAVTHLRQNRGLTRDELSFVLSGLGHNLDADDLDAIERGISAATVDDLVALAVALDVTPTTLLTHIPSDHPGSGPFATGMPEDVEQPELQAWMEGRTALDRASRMRWAQEQVSRLAIRSTFFEDQAKGARAELADLGELALQEADAVPVQLLHERIRSSEYETSQADVGLAYAERRLEHLQEVER